MSNERKDTLTRRRAPAEPEKLEGRPRELSVAEEASLREASRANSRWAKRQLHAKASVDQDET